MSFDPTIFLSLAFLFGVAGNFRPVDGYAFLRSLISILEPKVGVLYAVVVVTSLLPGAK